MAFDIIIINSLIRAAKESGKLGQSFDSLADKTSALVTNQINKTPISLPFPIKETILQGDSKEILSPNTISKVGSIPESSKPQIRETLDNIENTLNTIIDQKNTIQNSINTITIPLNSLESLTSTIENIISISKIGISALKAIPIPLGAPLGVGVPANTVIGFSDSLETAKTALDALEGPLSIIPSGISQINDILNALNDKINSFDNIITNITSIITLIRIILNSGPNATQQDIDRESLNTSANIRKSLTNPIISQIDDNLNPNSNELISYKGYILTTEYDPSNTFSFPRRRIKASLASNPSNSIFGPYSFSSSTQVLIDEIKFKIDQIVSNS